MPPSASTWPDTDGDKTFDLVIFDYDGTLSDTRGAIAHCLERAFVSHGQAPPARQRALNAAGKGLTLHETCLLLDRSLNGDAAALDGIVKTYRKFYRDEGESLTTMFPGARDVLRHMHGRGVKCLIVTNKGVDAVRRSLDRYGLTYFIDFIVAEQPGAPHKPNPALLTERILPEIPPIPKRRMLIVGDTEVDIQFAKNTGIACCWATYGFGNKGRCEELAPEYRIDGLEDLAALI